MLSCLFLFVVCVFIFILKALDEFKGRQAGTHTTEFFVCALVPYRKRRMSLWLLCLCLFRLWNVELVFSFSFFLSFAVELLEEEKERI